MKLKLATIQFNILPGKVDQNRAVAKRMISEAADQGAQIVCLPELFTTAYDFELIKNYYSESIFTENISWLGHLAHSLKIYLVAGSIPEKEEGRFYNTCFFFNDQGTVLGKYRKIHLFSPMGEDTFFTPGQDCPVMETCLGKIGISICYDLRFPAQFADLVLKDAEIVFIPAQFPHPRLDHWRILLRARAIENHVFIAGCNRVGNDGRHLFCGHSCIISPWGETLAEAGERECGIIAELDLDMVLESRVFFTGE